jgi:DNA-binding NarL/FixJ family response regulator
VIRLAAEKREERRYLVIDAHPLRRIAAVEILEMLDQGATVVVAGTVEELRNEASADTCRLVILNVGWTSLGDPTMAMQIATIHEALSGVPLVVVSDHDEPDEIAHAFRAGVQGFLPTSLQPRIAAAGLKLVLAGGLYFPPSLPTLTSMSITAETAPTPARPPLSLSHREQAVVACLRQAQSNKMIARKLEIQESTVKMHVRRVMRKLGATNRTQAALLLSASGGFAEANGRPDLAHTMGETEIRV